MEVKQSTLGAYQNAPVAEPKLTDAVPATDLPVTTNEPAEAPVEQAAATVVPEETAPVTEAEVVAFDMPSFEQPAAAEATPEGQQPAAPAPSWKDVIKTADRSELLKELGLTDFAIQLNEHLTKGGSAEDYLHAKAVDWNKVPDADILKQSLKAEFPSATAAQIDRLFNKKYSQHDLAEEEDKEDGLLLIEADARKARSQRIEQQSKFRLPEQPAQQATQPQVNPEAEKVQQEKSKFADAIINSDTTKSLFQSKRVAIQTGDGRTVNLEFANPKQLLDVIFDPNVAKMIGRTPQGEPDVQFWLETAAFMANRQHYKKMLVGNPKELAKRDLVDEGHNAQRPAAVIPAQGSQYANYGEAFTGGNIKVGKLGSLR